MSKEVTMTFRLESELRAGFSEAAAIAHRPAAQILRDFMRTYVNESQQRDDTNLISFAERSRRDAVNFAQASVALEGFKPHKADDDLIRRYIAGEITVSDAINTINESVDER